MSRIFSFIVVLCALLLGSCVTTPTSTVSTSKVKPGRAAFVPQRLSKVRTTAYSHNEGGSGVKNAVGKRLANGNVKSAAADWSRFPLGTRFRVVSTGQEYIIDDYGGALIGTNTIDLYKDNRRAMRQWGVRHVDIDILSWGSREQSLKVLKPRKRARIVRRMIASLERKKST